MSKQNLNKKYGLDKIAKDILLSVHRDVSYRHRGWLFFICRLGFNSIILYYTLSFFRGLFYYVFSINGVIDEEHLNIVNLMLWIIGIIFMVVKINDWSIENDD